MRLIPENDKQVRYSLVLLFILIICSQILRINVESTGYISPDSRYYLRVSENIVMGKGAIAPVGYPFDENSQEGYFSTWPLGYPALIVLIDYLTPFDAFWSSKMVNFIFLGLIFLLLYHWFGQYSWLPALYFCSFGKLEIYSYTWSEGPFLFFLLSFIFCLKQFYSKENNKYFILIIVHLIILALLRYAGLIYFCFIGMLCLYCYVQQEHKKAFKLLIALFISSAVFLLYLYINYLLSGVWFGFPDRFIPFEASVAIFIYRLISGLFNELLLMRNSSAGDLLFFITLPVQLYVAFKIFKQKVYIENKSLFLNNSVLLVAAIFYLFLLVALRINSHFETFNYRTLAPFSTPVFIYYLSRIRYSERYKLAVGLTIFFGCSLLLNLPKFFIYEWLKDVIQM